MNVILPLCSSSDAWCAAVSVHIYVRRKALEDEWKTKLYHIKCIIHNRSTKRHLWGLVQRVLTVKDFNTHTHSLQQSHLHIQNSDHMANVTLPQTWTLSPCVILLYLKLNIHPHPPVLLCWPARWATAQSNPENSSAPTSTSPWRTTMYRRWGVVGAAFPSSSFRSVARSFKLRTECVVVYVCVHVCLSRWVIV